MRKEIKSIFLANWCLLYTESFPSIEPKVGINADWKVSPEEIAGMKTQSESYYEYIWYCSDPKKAAMNISLTKPDICDRNTNVEFIKEFFVKSIL